jgi:hypoxanthine phosphoribosyltransferase
MNFLKLKVVTLEKLEFFCNDLSEQVKEFNPELVISIDNGGWYLGHKISRKLQIKHLSIKIKRKTNFEKLNNRLPVFLRLIFISVEAILFHLQKPSLISGLSTTEIKEIENKRILLVDDAIHSGKTMEVAVEYLNLFMIKELKILVLSDFINSNKPHYKIINGHCLFPWSRISKEYGTFLKLRQQNQTGQLSI